MHDPASELRRIPLPRTPVNKGKRAARWEVTRPPTKVCRRDSTREGVYDCRVRTFLSRRQLANELFQHGQVVIHVLAGGCHRGCRPRADERLPHASVGKVDVSADSPFWAADAQPRSVRQTEGDVSSRSVM